MPVTDPHRKQVVELDAPSLVLIAASFAAAVGSLLAGQLFGRRSSRRVLIEVDRRLASAGPDAAELLGNARGFPRIFYFLDSTIVMSLYRQLCAADSLMLSREVETTVDGEAKIAAEIGPVRPSAGRKRVNRIREIFEPEKEPDRVMAVVQQRLLELGAISTLACDSVVDNKQLQPVFKNLKAIASHTGFVPPEHIEKDLIQAWIEYHNAEGIERMSNMSGFVAIDADYSVFLDDGGDSTMTAKFQFGSRTGRVRVHCHSANITSAGRMALSAGTGVRVTCLGQVVRWESVDETLVVLPLAVF